MGGDSRTVTLRVPARPEYVLLGRLALSAVCRLTPLSPDQVADLKLAITEAAAGFVGPGGAPGTASEADAPEAPGGSRPSDEGEGPGRHTGGEGRPEGELSFSFEVGDERLCLDIEGPAGRGVPDEEAALARAVIDATVDRCEYRAGAVRLVKYLDVAAA